MKRFKENLKEEEKLAVKRVEVSSAKSERKVAVNRSKLELQYKRVEKVSGIASVHILCILILLCSLSCVHREHPRRTHMVVVRQLVT